MRKAVRLAQAAKSRFLIAHPFVHSEDVKVALHKNETRDESVVKYLETYAGVTSTLLGNIWNEEQKAKFMPPFGAAVKEVMKAKFGDGEVVLGWEAYCVTARVPSSKP